MDPRFGPAWIAFAHTFALEGEHDHAVTAYSTCARMFAGFVYITTRMKLVTDLKQVSSAAPLRRYGADSAVKPLSC